MLRAALRPAPLALLVVALLAAAGCALLGQWQLERSRSSAVRPALERPVALGQVLEPATTFTGAADGQVVSATGAFTGGEQVLVDGRLQGGVEGRWVVAPLAVTGADGEVALLPVVRGWLAPGAAAPAAPAGPVRVQGRLIAGEPPQGLGTGADGAPQLAAVSPTDLVNVWDGRLYTGFVIAAEPVPAAPLEVVPSRPPTAGTDWRNVSYALQWWLFAGFAVVVWWRVVRDRYVLPELEGALVGPGPGDEPGDDEPGDDGWEDGTSRASRPAQQHQEVR